MTSDLPGKNGLEIRMRKRITELEKANQELRAEVIEHKRKEEALLQSEFRYQTLFNSIDEGFCVIEMIFDENGKPVDYRFLETNSAFEKQTGLINVQGKRMRELAPEHEEHWFEIYGRVALTGQPARFQNHAEQLNRWYEVYAFRFGEPEKRQVAIIFNNIAERKQTEEVLCLSEEKFSVAFANNPAAISLTRLEDGLLLDVNDTWVALNGYSRDEAIGHSGRKMNIWPTDEAASRFVQELREKGSLSGWEQEFYKKTGESYVAQLSAQILTIGEEKVILSTLVDITERKRAEKALSQAYEKLQIQSQELQAQKEKLEEAYEALSESEKRYRLIFDNSMDAIILTDPRGAGKVLSANPAAYRMLGYSEKELLGKMRDAMFDRENQVMASLLEERARSGSAQVQTTYRRKDGTILIGELNSTLFTDINGEPRSVTIIRDITERKQTEEALRESEARFRTMFEAHGAPMLLIEPDSGQIIDANDAATRFYKYSREQLRSMRIDQINQLSPQEVAAERNKAVERGKNVFIFRHRLASGDFRWVEVYSSPVTIQGQHILFSIIHDITERKRAEEALKEAYDSLEEKVKERTAELEKAYNSLKESEKSLAQAQKMSHLGNWEWDITTDKLYWSDEVYRIFGRKPQEFSATYDVFLSYIHPADRDFVDNAIKEALSGRPYSIDYRIILASDEERVVHAQGEVTSYEKNIPAGMRGTVQDITERKLAEEALAKMEKIRIKEIHHRIKNNLQVISSLLDLQAETFSHLETCKTPDVVEAFMESQNRVISMALIHEELYKGDEVDTLDFAAYMKKLTEDLFSSYNPGDRNISLKLNLDQVYLGMDTAIPLGIVVNELVSNSFKHAFPAGKRGEIQINLSRAETFTARNEISDPDEDSLNKEKFHYILTVKDNGIGIPEEIDFQDTDSLGLQLVNILVEQIDGCIELRSNRGMEFIIRFNNLTNNIKI